MKLLPTLALLSSMALSASAQEFPVFSKDQGPALWHHQDIGVAEVPGKMEFSPAKDQLDEGIFTVHGAMDIWGVADGCHFVYQPRSANFELIARVTAIDNPGGVAHAKASLCARESLEPGARAVTLSVTASDGTQFLYRQDKDGKTVRVAPDAEPPKGAVPKGQFPCWLKLVRQGNEFTGYESVDGKDWVLTGRITLPLPNDTMVGLAASSHRKDILTSAIFDHVVSGYIVGSQF